MDREIPQSQYLTPSRTREASQTRSIRSEADQSQDLRRIHTAQSFDDHAAYNRHQSASGESSSEPLDATTGAKELKKKREDDADDDSSINSSTHSQHEPDIEKGPASAPLTTIEKPEDPYLVTWKGPDDPENPKNWRMRKKWAAAFIVSSFTLISPVSSSMVAPALQTMSRELGIKTEIESAMILSIFVLAYAIGPLFLGPLSEIYGRVIVLQLANLFYLVWNLACGFSRNGPEMLVFRFLSGLGGSAPLAIGGAVLGDCFAPEQRGRAISLYSLAPLLGPAIGPIAGGYIAQATTWRWIFWATSILDALIQISGLFFLQETYAPKLLQTKAKALRKETGNPAYYTQYDSHDRSWQKVIGTALIRPFRMLFTQPIIQAIAVYMAFIYGLMYLMLASFPLLWTKEYGESEGTAALNYISLAVGFFLGAQITAPINDRLYRKLKARNNGVGRPEFRVPVMIAGSIIIPIGLFWYGWSARAHAHWIMPNIGAAIFCAGAICCFQAMQTYIVDSYTRYAASGIAAAVVMRSLCGFGFPLFAQSLFKSLGYGWGNSLLAFVGIGLGIPAPLVFWKYGERLRAKSKYASE